MSENEERIRCLTVSDLLPSVEAPGAGIFILRRQASLPPSVEVEAWRLRPWFPGIGWLKPHLRKTAAPRESRLGVPITDLRFPYFPGVFKSLDAPSMARRIDKELKRHPSSFDLIDAHFAYPAGAAATLVARKRDLASVITLRGTLGTYLRDKRRDAIVEALRSASRVIAVSTSLAELAQKAAGDIDVRVIGNGIDTQLFGPGSGAELRSELGLKNRGPVLLTVGGLVPRKGMHRVLEVLPHLRVTYPDIVYLIVGGGGIEGDYEETLREQVRALDLEDNVRFCGPKPPEELVGYYRAADVFCLATQNEGWANVLQEALACGTPVVTTDVGGNREVLGGEQQGFVVPLGDAGALQEGLLTALQKTWDREAIAHWGRRRDWTDVGMEVYEVYREARNGR